MAFLCAAGFGLFSLTRLPLERLPDVDFPVIAVITNYAGASPQDVETLITEPVERAVASVDNVERIRSTSRQGTSVVTIELGWGTDMDNAEIEVRKNLELFAEDVLPEDAPKPLTFTFNPRLAPVIFMSVNGPLDGHQLRRIASEQIEPYLTRIDGVASAEVIGGLEREILVELEPVWLQANGLSATRVVDALRGANLVVSSGAVDDGQQALAIQPTSELRSLEEIRDVVVGQRGGRAVHLREVAEVTDSFADQTHVITTNGRDSVQLAVRKQSDANTVQVAKAVRKALPSIQAQLPSGVELSPLFDESKSILRAVKNLRLTALQALLLTALVLLAFLRALRPSLITLIAIPTSVLFAFSVMDGLDVTLNLISMAGLALAVGMLVDNGIVVVEASFQHVERGVPAREAAIQGAREMSMPLVASTLTTVAVFAPMMLVDGIAKELFRDLVLTICVTLLSSLVVAVTMVPLMASRMLRSDGMNRGAFAQLTERYVRALDWSLSHRKTVLLGAALMFGGSLAAVPLLGTDFLPKSDVARVRLKAEAAPGISLSQLRSMMTTLEERVRGAAPEADAITADYGESEGFGAIFGGRSHVGSLRVRLPPVSDRTRGQQEIEAAVMRSVADIPGLDVEVGGGQMGVSGDDLEVKLYCEDLDTLRKYGFELEPLLAGLPEAADASVGLTRGSPQLGLQLDRERLRTVGLTAAATAAEVATHFRGTRATLFRDGGGEFAVRVRAKPDQRDDTDALRYLPIALPTGTTIPLGSVARLEEQLGPTDIERENQRRMTTVSVTASGMDLGALVKSAEAALSEATLPPGVSYAIGGSAESMRDSFFKLGLALVAALLLVYMVMASQFESLLEPFVIMFSVPLAVIGVVGALALTGTTLQVTALVGVILLGGVVVNNGIVLIDVIKRLRAEGQPVIQAALTAGRTRLRPILMTALTTILGMVPLSLGYGDGAETWAPMARAVVGGMVASTALTLFVIPVFYVTLSRDRRPPNAAPKAT